MSCQLERDSGWQEACETGQSIRLRDPLPDTVRYVLRVFVLGLPLSYNSSKTAWEAM
jgi:hypothetical protein